MPCNKEAQPRRPVLIPPWAGLPRSSLPTLLGQRSPSPSTSSTTRPCPLVPAAAPSLPGMPAAAPSLPGTSRSTTPPLPSLSLCSTCLSMSLRPGRCPASSVPKYQKAVDPLVPGGNGIRGRGALAALCPQLPFRWTAVKLPWIYPCRARTQAF